MQQLPTPKIRTLQIVPRNTITDLGRFQEEYDKLPPAYKSQECCENPRGPHGHDARPLDYCPAVLHPGVADAVKFKPGIRPPWLRYGYAVNKEDIMELCRTCDLIDQTAEYEAHSVLECAVTDHVYSALEKRFGIELNSWQREVFNIRMRCTITGDPTRGATLVLVDGYFWYRAGPELREAFEYACEVVKQFLKRDDDPLWYLDAVQCCWQRNCDRTWKDRDEHLFAGGF